MNKIVPQTKLEQKKYINQNHCHALQSIEEEEEETVKEKRRRKNPKKWHHRRQIQNTARNQRIKDEKDNFDIQEENGKAKHTKLHAFKEVGADFSNLHCFLDSFSEYVLQLVILLLEHNFIAKIFTSHYIALLMTLNDFNSPHTRNGSINQ